MVTAKNDFRSLLKETKLINYKSKEMIDESDRHYTDVVDVLKVHTHTHTHTHIVDVRPYWKVA